MASSACSTPADEPAVDLKAVAYALHMRGKSNREIAEALNVGYQKVCRWINQAADDQVFGRLPSQWEFTPRLDCKCVDDPLKPGQKIVCVNCCASGYDFHPKLHADPLPKDKKVPKADALMGGTT